ncbi:stress response translation initiation inhibitor YciH [Zobellella endophytica]|uniref:Stress response translation initiation inhibitor YciH n=1 Tax=Zobellella endophytica TaxID=2116700 RepID=A0A2P7RBL6_9GAMM|nr:stress response translation initiation inhibitor YciH [Zobellella endophytica]PSJ47570.1 stress response translation initiation inhibitor YciH [Zobellella endophytica]
MNKLVYSTDPGWRADDGQATGTDSPFPADGLVRLRRETKGRKGAGVICIYGVPMEQLKEQAKRLKSQLGTGGAIKDGVIEIQGDRLEQVAAQLTKAGFQVKKVGG